MLSMLRGLWELIRQPEQGLRQVLEDWTRGRLLEDHPVRLLADRIQSKDRSFEEMKPECEEAKARLKDTPALSALLFPERVAALDADLEARFDSWSADEDRTLEDLVTLALLNHHAAKLLAEPQESTPLLVRTALTAGRSLSAVYQLQEAANVFQEAVAMARQHGDPAMAAQGWTSLGAIRFDQGHLQDSLDCHHKARDAFRQAGDPLDEIAALGNAADVQVQMGRLKDADADLNDALAVAREHHARAHEAEALRRQAEICELRGSVSDAIARFEQAATIYRELQDARSARSTLEQVLRANLFCANIEQAHEIQREISQLDAEDPQQHGEDHGTYHHLAQLLDRIGEFRHSLAYQEKALEQQQAGGDRRDTAETWSRLGVTYGKLGNWGKSKSCFDRALEIERQVGALPHEATVLANRGVAAALCGQLDQAIGDLRQAAAKQQEIQARLKQCQFLNLLAGIQLEKGSHDDAESSRQASLRIAGELGHREEEFRAVLGLADVFAAREQFEKAAARCQQALGLAEDLKFPAGQGAVLSKLGALHLQTARPDEAQRYLEQALPHFQSGDPDPIRQARTLLGVCEETLQTDGWQRRALQQYLAGIEAYRQQRLAAPALAQEADPREAPYRLKLQQSSQELFDRGLAAAERLAEHEVAFRVSELKHATILAEWLAGDFLFLAPRIESADNAPPPTPERGEALLVYSQLLDWQGGEQQAARVLALLRLADGSIHPFLAPAAEVNQLADSWNDDVKYYNGLFRRQPREFWTALAQEKPRFDDLLSQLHDLLLPEKCLTLLEAYNVRRLIIVPEGRLYGVPFAALRDKQRGDYLIDRFEVVVAPNCELWQECRRQVAAREAKRFLGVANPAGFAELEPDEPFVEELGTHLAGPHRFLFREQATVANLLEEVGDAQVIHLMLHGSPEHELDFAKQTEANRLADSTLFELTREGVRFPHCALFTMNACFSSGVEHAHSAAPGEITGGFPTALMALGVPTIVGALWQLFAGVGYVFFREFYQGYGSGNTSAAEAFQAGIRAVREHRKPEWQSNHFDHPFFWAGLALMGDAGERHVD